MTALVDTWKELRGSPYSGDLALALITWGSLRWAFELGEMTLVALALGAGLLSSTVDLMPGQSDA